MRLVAKSFRYVVQKVTFAAQAASSVCVIATGDFSAAKKVVEPYDLSVSLAGSARQAPAASWRLTWSSMDNG